MDFRIADTFTDSLARLSGEEQKAVKTTAFDLQMDPSAPGMQFHRINRAKDPNFWSVRVSRERPTCGLGRWSPTTHRFVGQTACERVRSPNEAKQT